MMNRLLQMIKDRAGELARVSKRTAKAVLTGVPETLVQEAVKTALRKGRKGRK